MAIGLITRRSDNSTRQPIDQRILQPINERTLLINIIAQAAIEQIQINIFQMYILLWFQTCAFHTIARSRALYYISDLTLAQAFQPMAAQLSMKDALPLAEILNKRHVAMIIQNPEPHICQWHTACSGTLQQFIGNPWWSDCAKPIGYLIPCDVAWCHLINQLCAFLSPWQLETVPGCGTWRRFQQAPLSHKQRYDTLRPGDCSGPIH